MSSVLNSLYRLVVPAMALTLSVYASFHFSKTITRYQSLIVFLPYLSFTIALLLALQFNRLRLFLAALICLLTYLVIQWELQQPLTNPEAFYLYTAISLLIPINLSMLAILPEHGLRSSSASFSLLAICLQAGAVYWLSGNHWPIPEAYLPWLAVKPLSSYVLSLAASALFGVTALLIFVLGSLQNGETARVLLTCLVSIFLTLTLFSQAYISSTLLGVCGLFVIYGVFQNSHDMAFRDELTGLRNRRAFNEKLRSLQRRYVIATMDVDHFKKFNDTYGHEVGDDVLKLVAAKISQVGGGGIAYRYGGEEFCIVFPGKEAVQCVPHLEAVRMTIENYRMALRDQKKRPNSNKTGKRLRSKKTSNKTTSVTISIGVAERNLTYAVAEEVLKGSDSALYRAKKAGRNCLVVAQA